MIGLITSECFFFLIFYCLCVYEAMYVCTFVFFHHYLILLL